MKADQLSFIKSYNHSKLTHSAKFGPAHLVLRSAPCDGQPRNLSDTQAAQQRSSSTLRVRPPSKGDSERKVGPWSAMIQPILSHLALGISKNRVMPRKQERRHSPRKVFSAK